MRCSGDHSIVAKPGMDHLSTENLFSEMEEVEDAAFLNEWMDTLDNNFVHFYPNDPFFPPAYGTENSDGGVIRKPAVMNSVQCQPSASSSFADSAVSRNPSGGIENPAVKVKMKMKTEMDHRESSGKTMISFMPSSSHYCSGRGNDDEHRESLIRTIEFGEGKGKKGSAIRSPLQAQDHVLAERKRRETLTQRFISLSSLIPDLKKVISNYIYFT
ncbi:PREDICTED: uncharacterized protein LOC109168451 [Ipomoea nil]|uniref:uncharacterized protein LOC109168451 n=1 Tax=Ipomoea nil TaxID=35883 RepID=UPI00090121DE|nr:PREDICTED: uncharacterized protein LOC109168451 [Ipomoea nil]